MHRRTSSALPAFSGTPPAWPLVSCPGSLRHGLDVSENESWYLVADEADAFARRFGLNNDEKILVTWRAACPRERNVTRVGFCGAGGPRWDRSGASRVVRRSTSRACLFEACV